MFLPIDLVILLLEVYLKMITGEHKICISYAYHSIGIAEDN